VTPPVDRYHRQTLLAGIGSEGQNRLGRGHAMIIGCGALGCAAADLLARAGVGRLTLVDRDTVEWTNLQRQTLFDERDAAAGAPKAEAAARRLRTVNSSIVIEPIADDLAPDNAEAIVVPEPRPGVLLDCTDNFETRYLLNDAAVKHGIPLVYGGAVATGGVLMTVRPGAGPCLRCVFPDPPAPGTMPTCDSAGVLAPATAIVGALQAAEAIKILAGREEVLDPALRSFDLWSNSRQRLDLAHASRTDCPCCGAGRYEFLQGRQRPEATVLCGRGSVQISPGSARALDLDALAERLRPQGPGRRAGSSLRQRLTHEPPDAGPIELTVFTDGRAIVSGTTDPARARGVYHRYVGA